MSYKGHFALSRKISRFQSKLFSVLPFQLWDRSLAGFSLCKTGINCIWVCVRGCTCDGLKTATHSLTFLPCRGGESAIFPRIWAALGLLWPEHMEELWATPRTIFQEDSWFLKAMSYHVKISNMYEHEIKYRDLGPQTQERGPAEPSLPDEPTKVPCISWTALDPPGQSPAKYYQVTLGKPEFLIHRIVKSNTNAMLFKSLSFEVDTP